MSVHFIRKNLFTQSPKIFLYHNNKIIGHSTYSQIDHNTACINNLFIEPTFRKQNYGSKLLQYTEKTLKNGYHKEKCTILVHELPHDNLKHFFKLNGYYEQLNVNGEPAKHNVYDDGSNIFTLIPMYKIL